MGALKEFLIDEIDELAKKIKVPTEQIYHDDKLYEIAVAYADLKLMMLGIGK